MLILNLTTYLYYYQLTLGINILIQNEIKYIILLNIKLKFLKYIKKLNANNIVTTNQQIITTSR